MQEEAKTRAGSEEPARLRRSSRKHDFERALFGVRRESIVRTVYDLLVGTVHVQHTRLELFGELEPEEAKDLAEAEQLIAAIRRAHPTWPADPAPPESNGRNGRTPPA
jgi:hypothetical protein